MRADKVESQWLKNCIIVQLQVEKKNALAIADLSRTDIDMLKENALNEP